MPSFREECAVFGIWNDAEASRLTYLGLYAQQHRGQESCGIVSLEGKKHHIHKGKGLVADVFREPELNCLPGKAAIGHVRYSTTGKALSPNIQPLTAQLLTGPVAVAHNGNIVNSDPVRLDLKRKGTIFQGTNDTEVVLHLLARNPSEDPVVCLREALQQLQGAFSMVMMTKREMLVARDPQGFRPLVLGERENPDGTMATVVASETCAFDLIGARFLREVEPGELIHISDKGMTTYRFAESKKKAHCVFEHVYFARPDSLVFGRSVYESRKNMGRYLAKENPIECDIVIPVPDSGVPAAIGYAEEAKVPFEFGIIRNHYVGRTFIEPEQSIRSFGVKVKLNPQQAVLKDRSVVVVDDSLVRGTTSRKIINLVRQAGAREVHLRIASPPTTGSCYYGVDTPKPAQLIASHCSVEEIRDHVGADTLGYISMEGMMQAVRGQSKDFCAACFDGKYPTDLFGLDAE